MRIPMTVIGIDQSLSSTGIAVMAPDAKVTLHTIQTNPMDIELRLKIMLTKIVEVVKVAAPNGLPEMVCLEGVSAGSFGATNSVLQLGALHHMIRCQLHSMHIPFMVVAPSQLKKFVAGHGGSKKDPVKKEHMMKFVLQRWGIDARNNDEADAAGLAYIAAGLVGLVEPTMAAQRDVLDVLRAGPKKKTRGSAEEKTRKAVWKES